MENENKEKKQRFTAGDTIIAFLVLELLALTSFGLGGAFGIRLFDIFGFFLGILSLSYAKNNLGKDVIKANLKWFIPLGVFFILLGFSAFFFKYYGGFAGGALNTVTSILYLLLEAIGLIGFFLLGLGIRDHGQIKKEYILYAFLGGLALYCFITGFYNLIRYGFFYAGIYRGLVYYYQGVFFPVDAEAKALIGFSFKEVKLEYACFPAVILSCAGVGLLKMNPKTDERKFFILLGLVAVGFLYLILIPAWWQLLLVAVVYAFFGIYLLLRYVARKYEKSVNPIRWGSRILYGLLIAGVAFLAFAILTDSTIGIVTKLFQAVLGRVPMTIQTALRAVKDCIYNGADRADLGKINFTSLLFGFNPSGSSLTISPTRFFQINVLWENGLIAFLLLLFVILLFVKKERDYLARASEEEFPIRLTFVAVLFGIVAYASMFANEMPLVHGSEFLPFTQGNVMLLVAFLLGVTYELSPAKEAIHE